MATILNPILIAFIDLVYHNYDCVKYDSHCSADYTANSCPCFTGDFIKLWDRMKRDESSGMTGAIITVMLYVGSMIISTLLLYEYLVYVHKDARILDLWRRTKAPAEEFFIPNDYEMTHDELMSICHKATNWRGPAGASRKVMISTYVERDHFDPAFEATTKHYAVYECTLDGKKRLYRHFLLLPDGSIIEIFEQFTLNLGAQYHQLNRLLLEAEAAGKEPSSHNLQRGRSQGQGRSQDAGDKGTSLSAARDGAFAEVSNPLTKAASTRGDIDIAAGGSGAVTAPTPEKVVGAARDGRHRSSGRRMSTELKQVLQHRKNRLFAGLEHA